MLKLATKFVPRQPRFEAAHQAGFRCAELWTDAAVLAEWESVAAVARHYPMEYVLHFPNRLDLTTTHLDQCVRLYTKLGCKCMVIHQPMHDKYRDSLLALAPGMRLAVENHKLNPEGFQNWAERNHYLALDVEHLWKYTLLDVARARFLDGARAVLDTFGKKIRHVHMPGYLPGHTEHRPMYCSRDLVMAMLSHFAAIGYEGLIVSEVDVEYQTPQELRMDVLLFDAWRAAHDPLSKPPPEVVGVPEETPAASA